MKRLLFLIESLSGGGAEKVLSTLVSHIDKEKFDVTVCAIVGGGPYEECVNRSVNYKSILKPYYGLGFFGRLRYKFVYHCIYHLLPLGWVYRLFVPNGFDVEVAFVEGFVTKLLSKSRNYNATRIAWVHCDLKNQPWTFEQGVYKNIEEERTSYFCYDKVVCVSQLVADVMTDHYGLSNTIVIYNPIDIDGIRSMSRMKSRYEVDKNKKNIVSVGRMERVKGYDLLIPVIKQLLNDGINAHLWLIGEGSERKAIEKQIIQLGIEENVTLTGFLDNPYSLMSQMDVFVCSSRAEGFSLVIAEAMVLGLPVVSTDCAGPRELIGENKYGILCKDMEEMHLSLKDSNFLYSKEYSKKIMNVDETISIIQNLFDANNRA